MHAIINLKCRIGLPVWIPRLNCMPNWMMAMHACNPTHGMVTWHAVQMQIKEQQSLQLRG